MTIGLQTILQLKNLTVKPQRFFCSSEIKFLFLEVFLPYFVIQELLVIL